MRNASPWLIPLIVVALSACGDDPPPSAPTPPVPAPAVASIQVSPFEFSLALGQTQQLSAVATMTDRTTRPLTNDVTWAVADPRVGTVSGRGLVTAHAYGNTTFFARLDDKLSSSVSLNVPVPAELRVPVTGVVRDQYGRPVANATVAASFGDIEHSATTDGNGFFDLGTGYGALRLVVTGFGYDDRRLTVPDVTPQRQIEVTLIENPSPAIERRFEVLAESVPLVQTRRIVTRAGARLDVLVEPAVCGVPSGGSGAPRSHDPGAFEATLGNGATNAVRRVVGTCAVRLTADVPGGECLLEMTARMPGRYVVTFREPR